MSRLDPVAPTIYVPLFGESASPRQRVFANAPALAEAFNDFALAMRRDSCLTGRLSELVRLRIAFHNQCRSCMAIRYSAGLDDGLTEGLVCSLEKPHEAPDLSDPERGALAFADKFANDHLSIGDDDFESLRVYFSAQEVMDLCFQIATWVGFGRMSAILDIVDDLPEERLAQEAGSATPWGAADSIITVTSF